MRAKEAAELAWDRCSEIECDKDGNPLTLEGAIRTAILRSPSMIQWRDDALNILYCTLGSGLHWSDDGRIIGRDRDSYIQNSRRREDVAGFFPWSEDFGFAKTLTKLGVSPESDVWKKIKAKSDSRLQDAIDTVTDIDERCATFRKERTSWYPLSWYEPNLAAPVHARPDFFQGAIEMATLIASTDLSFDDSHHWSSNQKVKLVATEILAILLKRKHEE